MNYDALIQEATMSKIKLLTAFLVLLLMNFESIGLYQNTAPRPPATGSRGMVSSAHPLATQAGLDMLAAGGNAFDAAVAVAAALNVVEPMMSGIGGYGTVVIYDARRRETKFLNTSGRIPASLDSDVFRAPTPNFMKNREGAKAVSTPGNLKAWEDMSKKYGKLPWAKLFDAAIKLADEGFTISDRTAQMIKAGFPAFPRHAKEFYGKNGEPLKADERLVQKDLANSFRVIASKGASALHGGEIGRVVAVEMKDAGSFLTLDDLRNNKPEWWETIQIDYRGYLIVTASPPANAFDMLVRLGVMSRFDLSAMGHNSVDYLHRFAEATKHGFQVRLRFAGDPDIAPPPLDVLLSEKYWTDEAAKIDSQHAKPYEPPKTNTPPNGHTTHFVVADESGNVVSATQTLGGLFGSKLMPRGTGIWLNNSLSYCTFEPKGNPMDAFPGRRKLSGDCPTIIFRDGRPWVAIGTPGGHTIGQTVPQMIMNLIDFKMNVQDAIAAPRISFLEPDSIAVERGIAESARNRLTEMGHKLRIVGGLGNAHGLTIEYDAKGKIIRFTGGSDPRGEGSAKGL